VSASFGFRELAFTSSIGGANLCSGGTPLTSGSSTNLANAFDGNTTTFYACSVSDKHYGWVGYYFGTPVNIVECRYRSHAVGATSAPWTANVQWSDDGVNWYETSLTFPVRSAGLTADDYLHTFNGWSETIALFQTVPVPTRLNSDWPTSDQNIRVLADLANYNPIDSGPYKIAGNVFVDDTPDIPVRRKVRLFNLIDGYLAREVWSDALTGAYLFTGIALRDYFVVSHDHTGTYNAVIKDRVTPEPI
jgi:hypothetical protein